MELKKTPLYQRHISNGARIVDFGGWALPVEYESMLKEAKATRTSCGLFDASHMGQIIVKGSGAFEFLQRLTTNDISLMQEDQQQYNILINERGGVIDDLMVYSCCDYFLCVVNAINKEKVCAWLEKNKTGDVEIIDNSQKVALICLQGPNSVNIMAKVAGEEVNSLKYMHCIEQTDGKKQTIISRSGYTGEDGFEIYTQSSDALRWWDSMVENGKEFGLVLCGLGARDILRIEAGYSLYGHELNEEINPLEASLDWVVKFNKDFIAKDILLKVKEEGPKRKKIGFIMQERSVPRQDYPLYWQGKLIGRVSSGTYSPNIDKFIGMGYVDSEYANIDSLIDVEIRGRRYKAQISSLPFLKLGVKR